MRPASFSDEQIIAAGKKISQTSDRPVTAFAIRHALGGGNAQRIQRVWDEYLQTLAPETTEPVEEIPAEVAEGLNDITQVVVEQIRNLVTNMHQLAVVNANQRTAEAESQIKELREQLGRQIEEAAQEIEQLETHRDTTEAENQKQAERIAALENERGEQARELAALRQQLAAAQEKQEAQRDSAEAESRKQAERIAALENERGEQARELAVAREKLEGTQADLQRLQRQVEAQDRHCEALRQELDQSRTAAATEKARAEQSAGQCQKLEQQNENLQKQLIELAKGAQVRKPSPAKPALNKKNK